MQLWNKGSKIALGYMTFIVLLTLASPEIGTAVFGITVAVGIVTFVGGIIYMVMNDD